MVRTRRASTGQPTAAAPPADAPTLGPVPVSVDGTPEPRSRRELNGKRDPKNVRARKASGVIRIIADANPHKEGSLDHEAFEKMRGGVTVLEYLSRFTAPEQQKARQRLYNAESKGTVKVIGGE